MAHLDETLTIKSVTFKNRIGMSPMCQYSAENGFSNNWHLVHYGTRAVGGTGLIMVEATAVSPEGRITPFDLGLWEDSQTDGLRQITEFVHQQGAVAGIQIAHAGRKASHDAPANGGRQLGLHEGGWQTLAPSPIPFDDAETPPHELTQSEISAVVEQFRASARRALEAGFRVLEIHAAHGYLVHEFLSPLSNTRGDLYGGNFENRIRLLTEIVEAVQTVWPADLPLFVRLSATDWAEGGWDLAQTIKLAKILKVMGVDLIDCSSGGNISTANIPLSTGYQVHFSEEIRKTGIMTATVGLITTHDYIVEILESDKADIVFLGRELLRNPYFVLKAGDSVWPAQYLRAKI